MDYTFIGQMAYNGGSQVTSALNSGKISIAVNNSVNYGDLIWCATCGACDGYIIIVDSYFMGKTDIESAQAICYCTGSLDNGVLLSNINKLASTKFEGPFATLEDGMNWVETNGLFITNQNYPPIITNGNVLHLDGGLPASYPMVGTSWYDLTGNENNGVLNNGVSYNSSFKGYLNFNGSNQYVSVSGNTNIPVGNSNYTIGVWFNADTLGDKGLVGWGNYETTNEVNAFRLTSNGLVNYWWANDLDVITTITPGIWYYAVATFDGTTRSIYVNGSLVGSDTPTGHNVTTSSNLTVGVTNNTGYFDGSISDVQIFDRALSDVEITQNYNSMVTRYNGDNTEICLTPVYCSSTPTPTPTPLYSGVCNTYFFGIDTFPGESTTFGYYEYPSGTYTQITITAPDAIFANAYSNPGVFYVSGDSGYTIENYGSCSLTPTPTSSSTSTPTPTPTPTNATGLCYEVQNEFNVSGECFDCPNTYFGTNTTYVRFLNGCEGSVISPPSNMTVLVTYSDASTETVTINSGTPAGYVSVGGSETLCGSPPSCTETQSPVVVSVQVTSQSEGLLAQCCSIPITNVYGFMAACVGGTINDYMGADVVLSGPVSTLTNITVDVTYSLNGNCDGQTFVQSIGVTVEAGQNQSIFDACQSGVFFQNGATICSACVSSCDNPGVDITLVDC